LVKNKFIIKLSSFSFFCLFVIPGEQWDRSGGETARDYSAGDSVINWQTFFQFIAEDNNLQTTSMRHMKERNGWVTYLPYLISTSHSNAIKPQS